MEKEPQDWLFPKAEAQKAEQQQAAYNVAQNYLIFEMDARGKAILSQWQDLARKKKIPAGASVQEYAAENAIREFVEGISAQIELAKRGPVAAKEVR